ncbi:MAG: phosphotransferase, partial [Butyrivibrio sp.]
GDLFMAVRALAVLHNEMEKNAPEKPLYAARSLKEEMEGHNREIKRIRKYLYGRNNRTEFELLATAGCDIFYEEGKRAIAKLEEFAPENKLHKGLCHGDYNFHNVCFAKQLPVVLNFDKQNYNFLMADLYCFMRKIMEKNDWDYKLGYHMIDEYDKERNITEEDIELLSVLFSYPEKFWKILNGYFNSNKAWIPQKKLDKMKKFLEQNEKRLDFIKTIYS